MDGVDVDADFTCQTTHAGRGGHHRATVEGLGVLGAGLLRRGGLKGTDQPFGYMDTAKWQSFINWMVRQKVLGNSEMAVDALTNDYLPSAPIDAG